MESIDVHSIFKDKSVISSVPNYFNNIFAINITNLLGLLHVREYSTLIRL